MGRPNKKQQSATDPFDRLTRKQQRFVVEYCLDHNAAGAVKRAGYKYNGDNTQAASHGWKLMQHPDIKAAIADREANIADEIGITKQALLMAQFEVFRKAMEEVPKVSNGKLVGYVDPVTGEGKIVTEVELGAANKALETLMRHRGMLTDRHEVETGPTIYTLDLADLGDSGGSENDSGPEAIGETSGDEGSSGSTEWDEAEEETETEDQEEPQYKVSWPFPELKKYSGESE